MTTRLTRRNFIELGCALGAATALAPWQAPVGMGVGAPVSRWPGHQPGKVYLGMSTNRRFSAELEKTGAVGLHRTFGGWNDHEAQLRIIAADHAADRLPWISFKPPARHHARRWRDLAAGRYDAELRARARDYAALDKPAIVTFHHEPSNDGTNAEGLLFAAAWCHIHDLFKRVGALETVAFVPVVAEWLFSPYNRKNPDKWITPGVLRRVNATSFLGIDIYQTENHSGYDKRLGRILRWADARGYPRLMLGVGETGASAYYGGSPETWMRDNWAWCTDNPTRIGAVSYFNSTANSKPGRIWALDEADTTKLPTYRAMLGAAGACDLRTL